MVAWLRSCSHYLGNALRKTPKPSSLAVYPCRPTPTGLSCKQSWLPQCSSTSGGTLSAREMGELG